MNISSTTPQVKQPTFKPAQIRFTPGWASERLYTLAASHGMPSRTELYRLSDPYRIR